MPDNVVSKTLQYTTQLVPSLETETREIIRDHLKTRIRELILHRVNDTCCVDTFFSSIVSVRDFTILIYIVINLQVFTSKQKDRRVQKR